MIETAKHMLNARPNKARQHLRNARLQFQPILRAVQLEGAFRSVAMKKMQRRGDL